MAFVEGYPNVFEQIKSVKVILNPLFADQKKVKMRGVVLRCVKFRKRQIPKLTEFEARVYDALLTHKLKPQTVYEWLLLEDVPEFLKKKLIEQKISIRNARYEYVKWKRMNFQCEGGQLMEEIRKVVRCLRWESQENMQ